MNHRHQPPTPWNQKPLFRANAAGRTENFTAFDEAVQWLAAQETVGTIQQRPTIRGDVWVTVLKVNEPESLFGPYLLQLPGPNDLP